MDTDLGSQKSYKVRSFEARKKIEKLIQGKTYEVHYEIKGRARVLTLLTAYASAGQDADP